MTAGMSSQDPVAAEALQSAYHSIGAMLYSTPIQLVISDLYANL
jgi:hypothetical protein